MKPLFTLPNRRVPFTAAQYIAENEARANRVACARIDFWYACIRLAWTLAAFVALAIVAGGLIHSAIILSR